MVLGSKGTLILDSETDVYLYKDSDTQSKVGVTKKAGGFALDTSASGDYAAPVSQAAQSGPVSRGYREEIEHWLTASATLILRTKFAAIPKSRWVTP